MYIIVLYYLHIVSYCLYVIVSNCSYIIVSYYSYIIVSYYLYVIVFRIVSYVYVLCLFGSMCIPHVELWIVKLSAY